ncbi:hypothetical protein [Melittangium boletus]|uniref:hypothetical protein n=1 Tax=Melittangium boletus TaxID=83453 RepID=UPI0014748B49|nr:hypothetical protein [Melittangium boletus]
MKRSGRRALGMAVLLALGTAAAKEERSYLFLRTPNNAYTVQVEGNDLNSADIQLTREGDSLRGRAFGRVVFLNLDANTVGGTAGGLLSRLQLRDKEGVTEIQGNFLGSLVHLDFGPQAISGTVGRCGYDLKVNADGLYEGSRSCGGIPQRPVTLGIPSSLTQQGKPMTVATLAMLLGST